MFCKSPRGKSRQIRKRLYLMAFVCLLPCLILFAGCCVFGAQRMMQELDYGSRQKVYVLLPAAYDPDQVYPCVWFMPKDGYSAQPYFYDGIEARLRDLETQKKVPPMIYVFPQFMGGADLNLQLAEAMDVVEKQYPAAADASGRGVIGTGVGGYLAFMLGYAAMDGEVDETPAHFSAIASHDGDFTSGGNPYLETYGDLYDILREPVGGYGNDGEWLAKYYTYIDCNSDSALAWAKGGSADLAYLYRRGGLSSGTNIPAWDDDVFSYSIRSADRYGTYLDNLARSLSGFARVFGLADGDAESERETEYRVLETVVSGDGRMIDLMGDWYFTTMDALMENEPAIMKGTVDEILDSGWKKWDVVQPGSDWWTEDFAVCLKQDPNYAGYAWYVREFEVPDGFDTSGLQIEAGMVDEADEVYINGVRVGQTGIPEEGGSYDMSNPWDEERVYPIPDGVLEAGINTVCVRVCNGSGAGGWYAGPIRIEAAMDEAADPASQGQRFYTASFASEALRGQETEYRVYLPEGYYESKLRYPVVYMLHGYGSTGKSFEIAGVPEVLDEGIASGEIPPCIVIFPSDGHPQKSSWWSGAYGMMLNRDLVSEVDKTLRTVDSRDYRFLAGESMGGGGAYLNALSRPELYGGVLDIYGALRYTGALKTFLGMDAEELGRFRHCMICGTHDMYCFDLDHMQMGAHLAQLKIPHLLEIDSGEHSSSFYLPRLKMGFAYLLSGVEPK